MNNSPKIIVLEKVEGSHVEKIFRQGGGSNPQQDVMRILKSIENEITENRVIYRIDIPYYVLALEFIAESLSTQLEGKEKEFYEFVRKKMKRTTFVSRRNSINEYKEETEDE